MTDIHKILVVDDEAQIIRVLRRSLTSHAYDVRTAADGQAALELFHDWHPDLVITDLSMPEMTGLDLCRAIRKTSEVPIIVLSVKGEEHTKVEALDAGADDYITKPFGINELLARVRATLRRLPANAQQTSSDLIEEDFAIDLAAHKILVRKQEVHLTPKEFDLLAFAGRLGFVLSQARQRSQRQPSRPADQGEKSSGFKCETNRHRICLFLIPLRNDVKGNHHIFWGVFTSTSPG